MDDNSECDADGKLMEQMEVSLTEDDNDTKEQEIYCTLVNRGRKRKHGTSEQDRNVQKRGKAEGRPYVKKTKEGNVVVRGKT